MLNISTAKTQMKAFLEQEMTKDPDMIRFVKLWRSGEEWRGTVELTESNDYLKKLGYPSIFDKNRYTLSVDNEGNVVGFGPDEGE